jgi:hypothetical protein
MLITELFPRPKRFELTGGEVNTILEPSFEITNQAGEGYRIELQQNALRVTTASCGKPRAEATIFQIQELLCKKGSLPACVLEDYPTLQTRGFMLDISRGRVPRRAVLEKLVHALWLLKFNQLQLYTEHVFQYRGHERVWRGTGALAPEDIRWLDALCRERGIELVPNQNTFGHMEKWLMYPEYHYIAESPAGYDHPLLGWRKSGGVLRPGNESLRFIDKLLEELLPNFSSGQVNIGCDETWELGEGASRSRVEQLGKHFVFAEHLQKLLGLAYTHGKRPQFWADVFMDGEAEAAMNLQKCLPVVWGYEPGHPFPDLLERLEAIGLRALLAPGTGAWNSFGGRWNCASRNIREACAASAAGNCEGILLTSWGDNGHLYPFSVMWPGTVLAGALAWSGEEDSNTIKDGIALLNGVNDVAATEALLQLGRLDAIAKSESPNMSGLYRAALQIQLKGIPVPYQAGTQQEGRAREVIQEVRQRLRNPRLKRSGIKTTKGIKNELRNDIALATDMTEWAINLVAQQEQPEHLKDLLAAFGTNWEATARSPLPPQAHVLFNQSESKT